MLFDLTEEEMLKADTLMRIMSRADAEQGKTIIIKPDKKSNIEIAVPKDKWDVNKK